LVDPELFARHTIGLNYCAIGIENIGSKSQPLTDEQVEANAELVKYLAKNILLNISSGIRNMVFLGILNFGKKRILNILQGKKTRVLIL
jgi:hypothetical protein